MEPEINERHLRLLETFCSPDPLHEGVVRLYHDCDQMWRKVSGGAQLSNEMLVMIVAMSKNRVKVGRPPKKMNPFIEESDG